MNIPALFAVITDAGLKIINNVLRCSAAKKLVVYVFPYSYKKIYISTPSYTRNTWIKDILTIRRDTNKFLIVTRIQGVPVLPTDIGLFNIIEWELCSEHLV